MAIADFTNMAFEWHSLWSDYIWKVEEYLLFKTDYTEQVRDNCRFRCVWQSDSVKWHWNAYKWKSTLET